MGSNSNFVLWHRVWQSMTKLPIWEGSVGVLLLCDTICHPVNTPGGHDFVAF